MVPAAVVDATLDKLVPFLNQDDAVIDGGNSFYHDDIRRAAELKPKGIHYLDVGTSGGVWGAERGYCRIILGDKTAVQRDRSHLCRTGPKCRGRATHPGPGEVGRHRRARLSSSAVAARSRSHEAMTLPRRQTSAMSARFRS